MSSARFDLDSGPHVCVWRRISLSVCVSVGASTLITSWLMFDGQLRLRDGFLSKVQGKRTDIFVWLCRQVYGCLSWPFVRARDSSSDYVVLRSVSAE